ncbi:MAG: GatB/YqeY domain-containing protein, partial [Deltaproteobacteria bacterium]|nr:GatB/YqeY domain-containing protein [Deltaproteobacteria bacterium]
MSLNQRIAEDLKQAMKAKDSIRLSCLRMARSASKNLQVEKRRELTDEEIQSV